ncbi:MAG TPA: MFS transporter [Saprospiraceae bacterium]|nr:MFS transporter [Saprospiraceae bacterium]
MENINQNRLFYASCFALITTALSFSIRAGILPELGEELALSATQLGVINSMWFFGFPISMVIGGLIYHQVGGKIIMQFAFFAHAVGILLTIYAGSYSILLISTFLIGLGNGCTEAACNPMIADAYEGKRMNSMLNRFHMWFPGGIVIGSLVSLFMTNLGLGWQAQIWVIMIPTLIYAYLFWGQSWPKPQVREAGKLLGNLKAVATPLFIFMLVCMWFTAQSEFGPTQWVELILKSSGATPMLVLALITGTMAVARYFGGEVVHRFDTTGVLLGSAVLATLGLFLFTQVTGPAVYGVAVLFALGVAYFWPNMIGFVADYIPKSGALGMSLIGAIGMLSSFFMQPIIGSWIDGYEAKGEAQGLTGEALELFTGTGTITNMLFFPGILIILFTILYFWVKGRKTASTLAAEGKLAEI